MHPGSIPGEASSGGALEQSGCRPICRFVRQGRDAPTALVATEPGEGRAPKRAWRSMVSDFSVQRTKMVDGQVRTTDVTDAAVLDAMGSVPRELFVPDARRPLAYIDEDLEIAPARNGQPPRYLMEPSPFAKLVQLAKPAQSEAVLEVGSGTGYGAAVLSQLAARVTALESDGELAAEAEANVAALGLANVTVATGALPEGWKSGGPFDVILVSGAVEVVPPALLAQLAEGGRLVVVEGRGNAGVAKLYLNSGGVVAGRRAFNAAVRPLPGFDRVPEFEF